MRRLEDLSAAELERRFPPRRPPPKPVPHGTEPVAIVRRPEAVPRLVPEAKPVAHKPRRRAPRPPEPEPAPRPPELGLVKMRCPSCRRPWLDTSLRLPCPFCGAER